MTPAEVESFLALSHARLAFVRSHTEVAIDGERWLVGFVQGAPCRQAMATRSQR